MKKADTNMEYEEYVDIQIHRASKKWGKRYEDKMRFRREFAEIWDKCKTYVGGNPSIIGCMGVKRNAEYEEFCRHLPKSQVFGVDIVPEVVSTGKNCFCYDFNKLPEDWSEKFDLLYSNSIDHSYDIEVTIKEWERVTKKGGYLMIVFSMAERQDPSDRYSFEPGDLEKLFPSDRFRIVYELDYNKDIFVGILQKI